MASIGEIECGIAQRRGPDPASAITLARWLDTLLDLYAERVLAVDIPVARRRGQLSATIGNHGADLLIAATALEHDLSVVTRNTRHRTPTGTPPPPQSPTSARSSWPTVRLRVWTTGCSLRWIAGIAR